MRSKPTFMRPWPGTYVFQLVVNDGLQDSKPDRGDYLLSARIMPRLLMQGRRVMLLQKALRSMAQVPTIRMALGL